MELKKLQNFMADELLSLKYLSDKGVVKTKVCCPKCGGTKLANHNPSKFPFSNDYKCKDCGTEINFAKDSILEIIPSNASSFIGCLYLFANGYNEEQAYFHLRTNAWNYFRFFRTLLIGDRDIPTKHENQKIFYLGYKDGKVHISTQKIDCPDLAEMRISSNGTIPNLEFMVKFKRIKKSKSLNTGVIDELKKFYSKCRKQIVNSNLVHHVGRIYFNLLDLEYKYNHSSDSLFEEIINKLKPLNAEEIYDAVYKYGVL